MMDWYDGMGWGGWLIGCLMMLAFVAIILVVVVALVRGSRGGFGFGRPTAKDILDERFARGEIDIEEYTRGLDALRRSEDRPSVR
jgi:putative membrane protein